ncbi:hypothetical protein [Pontibacter chitinilyticus]|uniref:hypothetical protein n=1 Tax=Pontibacter chitinilyticus TaxID=2674989 RepID=UPI00321AD6B2
MKLKALFSRWTQIASLLLVGGAIAWILKLCVIISTNGRIINTGAAAVLMTTGLLLFIVGSTGIGFQLSRNRSLLLRIIAILLSPVAVFSSFLLIGRLVNPLFNNSSIWYAQQEAGIGGIAIVYLLVGSILYKVTRAVAQQR